MRRERGTSHADNGLLAQGTVVELVVRVESDGSMPPHRGRVGNLPLELNSFVGRRREVTEARRLLSVSRLVTLTGIGGVGKTRLALRVAADARRSFDDGVWLITLGELQDPALVADTVAAGLGLREQSALRAFQLLTDFLTDRQLLLVLDNCEHVVDAVAALAEELLTTCPDLRILATSREALDIGGEATLRVPPLACPDPGKPSSLLGLPGYDAVALFTDRACTAVPGFGLTETNRIAVAGICHRLDGLPLPIELAAARLRAMSAAQILQRLTDRYTLLTGGSRGAPTRQQTLRLCVDWSYELCTAPEREMWARLAVFAGSFELDAAEAICGGELAPDVLLDVVASLVDKSILIREERGTVVRYRLLETLRDYGWEKLREIGADKAFQGRHRDWYERLALRAEAEWISPRQLEWMSRLEREQPNLREALEFCLTEPVDADAGLTIAGALYPFWRCRGLLSEGRHWLDRTLAHPIGLPSALRVKALYGGSMLAAVQGDLDTATVLTEEGRVLAEQLSDPASRALTSDAAGYLALFRGDFPRAIVCFDAALDGYRSETDVLWQVWSLLGLTLASQLLGDPMRADACHEKLLSITESHGESVYRGWSLWAAGLAKWHRGDPNSAATLLADALLLARKVDDRISSGWCMETLAWIATGEHRAERAAVLMGAAESLSRDMGRPMAIFPSLQADHEQSERQTRRALTGRTYDAAFRTGKSLSFEGAVAYALDERAEAPEQPFVSAATTLTRRERQVADLVTQGLTNKAIADRLVISQRTAQGHVEHVLAKLGFTSRTQIAAWVVEHAQSSQS